MEVNAELAMSFYNCGAHANTDEWWYEGQQSLGNGRRHEEWLLILEHRASGERYGVSYGIGLDKHQGDSLPWETGSVTVEAEGPLVAKVVTETRWELPGAR